MFRVCYAAAACRPRHHGGLSISAPCCPR